MMDLLDYNSPFWAGTSIVIFISLYTFYQCFLSPLSQFPGPFPAKLTNLWHAYIVFRGNSHRDYVALHERYGSVVRVGPTALSIGDPSAFREIFKAGNGFNKSDSYRVFQGKRPFDLAGERNEKIHSEQRRLVARAYSLDSLAQLEPKVDEAIHAVLDQLDAAKGQTVDLGALFQLFAFDVIGFVSFSRPFGFVESLNDNGLFKRAENALKSMAWLMQAPWLFYMQLKLKPVIGNWLAATDRNSFFYSFATQEIINRKDRGGDDRDILAQLLTVQKAKPQLTDTNIAFMMTSNIFAGSDTTSSSLRSIFYCLLKHPEKYNKLMEELRTNKARGQLSTIVTSREAKGCSYLQAVMYEALRLCAPTSLMLDRNVRPGGMTIGQHYVPEKTVVTSTAWVIHRIPEIWGEDAEEFCPERWLQVPENPAYSETYSRKIRMELTPMRIEQFFFTFGGGSRTCIGRNISWLEMEKIIPTILMRYNLTINPKLTLKETSGILVFFEGLKAHVTRRDH